MAKKKNNPGKNKPVKNKPVKNNPEKNNPVNNIPEMDLFDSLQKILAKYPEDQQEFIFQKMMELGPEGMTNFLNLEYKYKRPDYTKQAKPMPDYMQQLMDAAMPHDVLEAYDKAHQALAPLGDDEKEAELRNFIYNTLAYGLTHKLTEETDKSCLPLFAAMQLVIDFNLTSLRNDVLETVKQDAHFYEFYFSAFDDVIAYTIAKLFKDDLDTLKTMMATPGFIYSVYISIVNSVVQMAIDHPEMRLKVILWLGDTIKECYGKTLQPEAIDLIVTFLAQIKAAELLPMLKEIYNTGAIPSLVVEGGFKEAQKLLKKGTDDLQIKFKDIREMLETLAEHGDESDSFFYDDEDDDYKEIVNRIINIPVYKYTLDITLDHSPHKVYRQLEVPSDITLAALGEILVAAVGWEGGHLHQFIANKGKDYYGIPKKSYGLDYDYDTRHYCIEDLLKRVGSKLSWEYDFGDSWRHTIKLVAKEKVEDGSDVKIRLTKGSGACPPEDCGGVWGYEDLLRIINDPEDEEYEDQMEWLGGSFDPDKFDTRFAQALINDCVSRIKPLRYGK